ncbi:GFA family protein [Salipiger sp. P9]|uniref:GFA family protein n=1 Tax=Salipiger pentaromativorans TaxID=2943193 RepID=UPI00215714B2|nr:GFA family protein [Salipiger pentaromativorans]MCR8547917.1 GFA family protein [Salipiger pentaromativorans]
MHGRCTCGEIRFHLTDTPLITHCCHCTWCQRETGSAFALNAMIETRNIACDAGRPQEIALPSASGKGQTVARCPSCQVALWSHYAGAGRAFAFVRVGTLDDASRVAPDVHIFTESAHPWIPFPDGARVFPAFYRRSATWRPEALERRAAELARVAQQQQQQQG